MKGGHMESWSDRLDKLHFDQVSKLQKQPPADGPDRERFEALNVIEDSALHLAACVRVHSKHADSLEREYFAEKKDSGWEQLSDEQKSFYSQQLRQPGSDRVNVQKVLKLAYRWLPEVAVRLRRLSWGLPLSYDDEHWSEVESELLDLMNAARCAKYAAAEWAGGQNGHGRSGRTRADYPTVQKEKSLAADWERARDARTAKVDFAKQHAMTVKQLDRLLARVRGRKRCAK